ncbi:MAG: hypothetical protein ACE5JG_03645, partial [Planctomycetota bacterium]
MAPAAIPTLTTGTPGSARRAARADEPRPGVGPEEGASRLRVAVQILEPQARRQPEVRLQRLPDRSVDEAALRRALPADEQHRPLGSDRVASLVLTEDQSAEDERPQDRSHP